MECVRLIIVLPQDDLSVSLGGNTRADGFRIQILGFQFKRFQCSSLRLDSVQMSA